MARASYIIGDADKYITVRNSDTGEIIGTITRPWVLAVNPVWTVANRDGIIVYSSKSRPMRTIVSALLLKE